MRPDAFKFSDMVPLILEPLRYIVMENVFSCHAVMT